MWGDLLHPDDVAHTLARGNGLLARADGNDLVNRFLCVDGHHHWFHTSASVIRDEAGNKIAFHGGHAGHNTLESGGDGAIAARARDGEAHRHRAHDYLIYVSQRKCCFHEQCCTRAYQSFARGYTKRKVDRVRYPVFGRDSFSALCDRTIKS